MVKQLSVLPQLRLQRSADTRRSSSPGGILPPLCRRFATPIASHYMLGCPGYRQAPLSRQRYPASPRRGSLGQPTQSIFSIFSVREQRQISPVVSPVEIQLPVVAKMVLDKSGNSSRDRETFSNRNCMGLLNINSNLINNNNSWLLNSNRLSITSSRRCRNIKI